MGIYNCKLSRNETKVLFQGLDASGKTTILYYLVLGEVVTSIPTIGFNVEKVRSKDLAMHVWDVGSRDKIRPLHRHYYPNTQAVVFVIDSTDRDRLKEVAEELKGLLLESELCTVPMLVLANKQDLESAMTVDEVKEGIGFEKLTQHFDYRTLKMFGCSAVTEEGQTDLRKAFDWLAEQVAPPSSWLGLWSSKGNNSDMEKDNNSDVSATDNTGNISTQSKDAWNISSFVKETVLGLKQGVRSLW